MANKKPGTYQNPPHVLAALKQLQHRYKNVQAEMERKLGLSKGRLSMIHTGRAPVTVEFLSHIKDKTGVVIPFESPVVAEAVKAVDEFVVSVTEDPSPKRVLAVVDAMERLTEEDVELLEKLINFRTNGEALNPRTAITAIQDITLLRDMLT